MIVYSIRRIGWAILTAFIASVVAFALFWTIPNVEPEFNLGGGQKSTEQTRERAAERFGLNDPLPEQYVRLMGGVLDGHVQCFYGCGNLRTAFLEALPVTFWLVLGSAAIAIGGGVWLALIAVRHRGQWQERLITGLGRFLYSVPSLVLSAVLWAFLCLRWGIFPVGGYKGPLENPIQWLYHLALPWFAGALPFMGAYIQVIRASMLETANEDWVRAARAKGLPEERVLRRHVLRNSLIPSINVWGLDFSHAFGGFALYVEVIFNLPGVGRLTADTLDGLDLPPIVALAIYIAIVVVVVSAVVDLIVAWLDPRIRRGGQAAARA